MKWLRTFRRSAIFVDVLLMLGAIIAIMGLTMFVRFNAKQDTQAIPLKPALDNQTVAEAETVAQPSSDQAPDDTVENQSNPSTSSPGTGTTTNEKAVCNTAKKASLIVEMNNAIEAEKQAINSISPLNPLYESLTAEHESTIEQLKAKYNAQLQLAGC